MMSVSIYGIDAILFFTRYASNGGSSRTRAFEYVAPLRALGVSASVIPRYDASGRPDAGAFDRVVAGARAGAVVVVQKPSLTFDQLAILSKACDGRLIADFDDAIWLGYGPNDPPDGLDSTIATLRAARAITVGSEYLARWARTVCDTPVHVLRPAVDMNRYCVVRTHSAVDPPMVVWVGSAGNLRDFEPAVPALEELLADRVIRLLAIADRPLELSGAEWVRWTLLDEVRLLASCDIGIMPLTDDERTRGRCGYKAVQYQAAGLPVIASPVGGAVETLPYGIFARSHRDWLRELTRLAGDLDARAQIGAAGREHVAAHHAISANAQRLAALIVAG